jgi:hypothetical protein
MGIFTPTLPKFENMLNSAKSTAAPVINKVVTAPTATTATTTGDISRFYGSQPTTNSTIVTKTAEQAGTVPQTSTPSIPVTKIYGAQPQSGSTMVTQTAEQAGTVPQTSIPVQQQTPVFSPETKYAMETGNLPINPNSVEGAATSGLERFLKDPTAYTPATIGGRSAWDLAREQTQADLSRQGEQDIEALRGQLAAQGITGPAAEEMIRSTMVANVTEKSRQRSGITAQELAAQESFGSQAQLQAANLASDVYTKGLDINAQTELQKLKGTQAMDLERLSQDLTNSSKQMMDAGFNAGGADRAGNVPRKTNEQLAAQGYNANQIASYNAGYDGMSVDRYNQYTQGIIDLQTAAILSGEIDPSAVRTLTNNLQSSLGTSGSLGPVNGAITNVQSIVSTYGNNLTIPSAPNEGSTINPPKLAITPDEAKALADAVASGDPTAMSAYDYPISSLFAGSAGNEATIMSAGGFEGYHTNDPLREYSSIPMNPNALYESINKVIVLTDPNTGTVSRYINMGTLAPDVASGGQYGRTYSMYNVDTGATSNVLASPRS